MAGPDKAYADWTAGHDDEARDTTRGQHRVVEGAGHWIYGDRPDAVLAAFREVVAAARTFGGTAANWSRGLRAAPLYKTQHGRGTAETPGGQDLLAASRSRGPTKRRRP